MLLAETGGGGALRRITHAAGNDVRGNNKKTEVLRIPAPPSAARFYG